MNNKEVDIDKFYFAVIEEDKNGNIDYKNLREVEINPPIEINP
ncbi:hypothetical protein J32TS6_05080 [Virgibacillus pantothenticus]|nr:hypothetical protein [Virgibacillus pantothenticus]GIP61953.1 hypothetical protein J32TS6_05080 [Virgibacillus pantothenticus]